MKLSQTVIITGANGQTAIRLAQELIKQKCRLALITHNRTERAEKLLQQYPEYCSLYKCNLTDYQQTEDVFTRVKSDFGDAVQGLVHTAAVRSYDAKSFTDSIPEVWSSIFSENVKMAYNILRCVIPEMGKMQKGKIVLFGSNVTRTGLPYGSAYAAAKTALVNLVRTIAWEIASCNIQINIVSPSPIETNLEEDYSGEYLAFRQNYFDAYKNSHPANRLVSVNDVCQIVLSLLDYNISSLSGEEIFVTGGVL